MASTVVMFLLQTLAVLAGGSLLASESTTRLGPLSSALKPMVVPSSTCGAWGGNPTTGNAPCGPISTANNDTFVGVIALMGTQTTSTPGVSASWLTSVTWFKKLTTSSGPELFAFQAQVTGTGSRTVNYTTCSSCDIEGYGWDFPPPVVVPMLAGNGTLGTGTTMADTLSGTAYAGTLISAFVSTRPTGTITISGTWNATVNPPNAPYTLNGLAVWKWVTGSFSVPNPTFTLANSQTWAVFSFTAAALPLPPTNVTVAGATSASVSLSWKNPPGSLTNDTVWYSKSGCPLAGQRTALSVGVRTSYNVTHLLSWTTYCFAIQAWDLTGSSTLSATVSALTHKITYGYLEKTYSLPGFNPLSGYLKNLGGKNTQIPTLVSSSGQSGGLYYVDNNSYLAHLNISNSTKTTVAHIIPLYQTYGYQAMLDDEFFIEYGYDQAVFFGALSGSNHYSVELVNITSGTFRMWNTTSSTDPTNQQPQYVGNNTVIVMSSDCSIHAWNLASHQNWNAGTLGANFGGGSCFEASNVYWFPQRSQLINIEAQGSSGDHVEQLNASYNGLGQIQFTSVKTIQADSGVTFMWVNGLSYNASTRQIAFGAGYWRGSSVYSYVISYDSKGLLTTTGEVRFTVFDTNTPPTGKLLENQRYTYTSDYVMGESYGNSQGGSWTNGSQFMFDPWNGSLMMANRSIENAPCPNNCFEGQFAPSPDYLIDFGATTQLNVPMYKVVYAYHLGSNPYPYGPAHAGQGQSSTGSTPMTTVRSSQAQGRASACLVDGSVLLAEPSTVARGQSWLAPILPTQAGCHGIGPHPCLLSTASVGQSMATVVQPIGGRAFVCEPATRGRSHGSVAATRRSLPRNQGGWSD